MSISEIKRVLILAYVLFILDITVFKRMIGVEQVVKGPFGELQNYMWNDIALNITLFISLGFFIGSWRAVLYGFFLSASIEAIQYISL